MYLQGSLNSCARRSDYPSNRRRDEPHSNDRDELDQIVEVMCDHVADDSEVDLVVPVHEDVSKADHVAQCGRQGRGNPAVALEQVEQLAAADLDSDVLYAKIRGVAIPEHGSAKT